jgi:hypothetical protein
LRPGWLRNVFELSPNSDGTYSETVLYAFQGGSDGAFPVGSLVRDGKGNLFGATDAGGPTPCYFGIGCGTIFELQKSASGWDKSTIYEFVGGTDGMTPTSLTAGAAGNLYGTTVYGGGLGLIFGYGTVFQLTRQPGGTWAEAVLYRFTGEADGGIPEGGVIFDSAGNLYGTTTGGGTNGVIGNGGGTVYKLTPSTGGVWAETTLHSFLKLPDGLAVYGLLVRSPSGGFLGTTEFGGASTNCGAGCGTIFEISPMPTVDIQGSLKEVGP